MDLKLYKIREGFHHEKAVLWIRFEKDTHLIDAIRQKLTVKWSASQKSWYALDTNNNRKALGLAIKVIGNDAITSIDEVNLPALNRYIEHLNLKAYSPNTIRTYTIEFAQLLYILKKHPVAELSPERIRAYILYCMNTLKMKENHLHSRLNAIKFYFEQVLGRAKFLIEIPRPKKPSLLPKVLDKQEIKMMLDNVSNLKHRLALKLCYGMGLRVREVVNIKLIDIDESRMQVLINQSKGKKDRYVNLPKSILKDLKIYQSKYTPKDYLFEGQNGGQYSIRSVQSVIKDALQKANIKKPIGIQGLRHS